MEQTATVPKAQELGLVPGLTPAELRKVYRQLARRYHPDGGTEGSGEIMRIVNNLHDELQKEIAETPPPPRPAARPKPPEPPQPEKPAPAASAKPKPKPKPKPAPKPAAAPEVAPDTPEEPSEPPCLGELSLTATAREMMSDALIDAVERWLVTRRGVPRNLLRRRLLLRMGRIGPVDCPGLHMPERISMTPTTLRFHFPSSPVAGLNLVAIPTLSNSGLHLSPAGDVAVLEERLASGQERFTLPPDQTSQLGFALELEGQALTLELIFDQGESDFSAGLRHNPNRRFRGLFTPTMPAR